MRRNAINGGRRERFFRRLKGFRGIRARYDKLARIFSAFIYPACICIALPLCEHALDSRSVKAPFDTTGALKNQKQVLGRAGEG
jgi:hypothetical protein